MNTEKRKRIGVILGNFHSDHPRRLVKQMWKLFQERDVDVRFYLGTESSSFMSDFTMQESKYDYQYASLYGYSRYDNLDLIIASEGTLGIYHDREERRRIFKNLPDVPVIRLEALKGKETDSFIIADNADGIRKCTEHLIEVHGCRDLAFLSGPIGNVDAEERLKSFMDTMKDHGLEVKPIRIMQGDFSENVDEVIEAMFAASSYPDGIVSANDEMTVAVYRVMRKHGLTPGKEIKVTGFDDWEMAAFMDPPLTTVRQDYEAIAEEAVKLASDIMDGGAPRLVRIPTPLICRCSCGCEESHEDQSEEMERSALIESVWNQKKNQRNSWIGALLNRELLEASNTKNFYYRLGTIFQYLDMKKANVYLLEKEQYVQKGEAVEMVPYLRRVLEYSNRRKKAYSTEDGLKIPLDHKGIPEDYNNYPNCVMVFLLFFEKYQYGTLHVEIEPDEIDFYYMLALEIGSSIRYLKLSMQQKAYQEVLKEKNQILDFTAHHDELTKVYNRTGVITKTLDLFRRKNDTNFAMLMADLDHLKQINDTFGHVEGDFAIRETARIISEVMENEEAVIGRTGGDEFVAVFPIKPPNDIRRYIREMHEKCKAFNEQSTKPYFVEISGGGVVFRAEDGKDFQSIMNRADILLYEDKKKRRKSVIREDQPPEE